MKLLAISQHSHMLGGGEHAFLDLVKALPPRYRTIAVVPSKAELGIKLTACGVKTIVVPLPSVRPRHAAIGLKSILHLRRLCRKLGIALIYANGSRAALYGGIVGKLSGIRAVWHCRISERDPLPDLLLTRLCDTVIANSRATAARFPIHAKYRVKVVYNGIDLRRFSSTASLLPVTVPPDAQVILMVARLSREKQHDLALAAFEVVAGENSAAHLVFVGREDAEDAGWCRAIKERAAASNYSDRIHWVGQLEDPRPWYRVARVFLLTSENESFGRVIVEALAAGVPVVAPRSGGIPEIIRDGQEGLLVAPGSASQTAAAVQRLLRDDKLAAKLRAAGRRRAEGFNLNTHVQGISAVFDSILKGAASNLAEVFPGS